ncbi:MAG: hypothetical protein WBD97_25880, partial [Pseudolabrys sp.]
LQRRSMAASQWIIFLQLIVDKVRVLSMNPRASASRTINVNRTLVGGELTSSIAGVIRSRRRAGQWRR